MAALVAAVPAAFPILEANTAELFVVLQAIGWDQGDLERGTDVEVGAALDDLRHQTEAGPIFQRQAWMADVVERWLARLTLADLQEGCLRSGASERLHFRVPAPRWRARSGGDVGQGTGNLGEGPEQGAISGDQRHTQLLGGSHEFAVVGAAATCRCQTQHRLGTDRLVLANHQIVGLLHQRQRLVEIQLAPAQVTDQDIPPFAPLQSAGAMLQLLGPLIALCLLALARSLLVTSSATWPRLTSPAF